MATLVNYDYKSFIKLTPDSTSKTYSHGYSGGGGEGNGGGENERQGLEQQ